MFAPEKSASEKQTQDSDVFLTTPHLVREGCGIALDIDETLSNTRLAWVGEMQLRFGNPEGLSAQVLSQKYRYAQDVPYWQHEEAFVWMEEARNAPAMHEDLPLIDGANRFAHELHRIVPIVEYVTARPPSVLEATKRWLAKHGFPEAPIVTKPADVPAHEGSLWKAGYLHEAHPRILGIVDDNSGLVKHLPNDYKGVVFLYEHEVHERTDIRVLPCMDWNEVLKRAAEHF